MKPNELASSKEFIAAITKVIEVMRDNNISIVDAEYTSRRYKDGVYHVQIRLPFKEPIRMTFVGPHETDCDFGNEVEKAKP